MQEFLSKSIEACRKARDIIFICYPITIVISGLWLFSYSLFIVKRMLPLPPDLLIYLFLFIPTTVGFIPAFTAVTLVYTKYSLKNLFFNELSYREITLPSKNKIILTIVASTLLGILIITPIIIPAFINIKETSPFLKEFLQKVKSASPLLIVVVPTIFTTLTGIFYTKHAGKKTTLSLSLQLIWLGLVTTISFLFPSLLSMLFITKSATNEMPNTAWPYLLILIAIYIIPFLSPLIFSALIQEIIETHERENNQRQIKSKTQKSKPPILINISAITMLIMAIPTIKWIIITPLSVAKLGYFEAKIVDREKKEESKTILVLWKAGNVILYRDMPAKNDKKNKHTNTLKKYN